MLDAIGESNVNSLDSGVADAEDAKKVLDRVTTEVLSKGWHINTDSDFKLAVDGNNHIPVPVDAISIDTTGASKHIDVTMRNNGGTRMLYDARNKTFEFKAPVTCDIVRDMDFEDLTFDLRAYIAAKASREYQESTLGSVSLDSFTVRKEEELFDALMDAQGESSDHNILTGSPSVRHIVRRNHPLAGR